MDQPKQIKLFVVSIMASCLFQDMDRPEIKSLVWHIPGLMPGNSFEGVAEVARQYALDKWKISENWYGHQVSVMSISKELFTMAMETYHQMSDDSPDETKYFNLLPSGIELAG